MLNLHPPIFILILALVIGTLVSSILSQAKRKFPGSLLGTLFLFTLLFNLGLIIRLIQYYTAGNIWPTPPNKSIFFTMFVVEYLTLCIYLLQLRFAFLLLTGAFNKKSKLGITKMFMLMIIPIGLSFFAVSIIVKHIMVFMFALPFVYLIGLLGVTIAYWRGKSSRHTHGQDRISDAIMAKLSLFFLFFFGSLIIMRFLLIFKELNHDLVFLLLPVHFFVFGTILLLLCFSLTKIFQVQTPSGQLSNEAITLFCQFYQVSPKEQEILMQLCSGKSNREIADQLYITINTVKFHISHIYQKTDVRNRVQLLNLISNHRL